MTNEDVIMVLETIQMSYGINQTERKALDLAMEAVNSYTEYVPKISDRNCCENCKNCEGFKHYCKIAGRFLNNDDIKRRIYKSNEGIPFSSNDIIICVCDFYKRREP